MVYFDIVHISPVDWDWLWARQQQLMSRMVRKRKVLFVEPPAPLTHFPSKKKAFLTKEDGLLVLSPYRYLPFQEKIKAFKKLNHFLLLALLRFVVRRYGLKNIVIWSSTYDSGNLVGKLGEKLVVYDCVDEHTSFSWSGPDIFSIERRLLAQSDLIFITSERLRVKRDDFKEKIYLVPNGVDFDHFNRTRLSHLQIPEEIQDMKKPIIGFYGYIADWVDIDLISAIALKRPGWNFLLIGTVRTNIDSLSSLKNVRILPAKDYSELPKYVACFDVCIIPFKVNELTQSADTIKLYEYLATGKPIVATSLTQAKRYSNVVRVANSVEEFEKLLEEALCEEYSEIQEKRMRIARQNSWDERAKTIETLISLKLERGSG